MDAICCADPRQGLFSPRAPGRCRHGGRCGEHSGHRRDDYPGQVGQERGTSTGGKGGGVSAAGHEGIYVRHGQIQADPSSDPPIRRSLSNGTMSSRSAGVSVHTRTLRVEELAQARPQRRSSRVTYKRPATGGAARCTGPPSPPRSPGGWRRHGRPRTAPRRPPLPGADSQRDDQCRAVVLDVLAEEIRELLRCHERHGASFLGWRRSRRRGRARWAGRTGGCAYTPTGLVIATRH